MTVISSHPDGAPDIRGAFNFRDLGGLATSGGQRIRPGVLFRSDTLQALTDGDITRLVDHWRIEMIVDLRTGREAVAEGRGPLANTGVCYLNAPLQDLAPSDRPEKEQTVGFYRDHLHSPDSALATALRVVCLQAGRPLVVHCAAGKDRTGLVTALLLKLLGVPDETVVADYLRTAPNMPRIVQRFLEWPRYRDHLSRVPPEVYRAEEHTMVGFLAAVDAVPGGAVGWANARGIDDVLIARLREGLLEPAPSQS